MRRRARIAHALGVALIIASVSTSRAQQPPDPLFRVTTELVLTDIVVFDRQGRFVDNIPREQFELLVDGQPIPIASFERVQAGSLTEDAQLAAARGNQPALETRLPEGGRTVLFFVDDFHLGQGGLSPDASDIESLHRHADGTARSGRHHVAERTARIPAATDRQQDDAPCGSVASQQPDSGHHRFGTPGDDGSQAQIIEGVRDRDLFNFFVKETMRQNPLLRPSEAENIVMVRARQMALQASNDATTTLATLGALVRSNGTLPGRKLVFFISDGFEIDHTWIQVPDLLRQIVDASARYNFVIYTMDSRGLITQPSYDASRETVIDPTRSVDRTNADELFMSQDPSTNSLQKPAAGCSPTRTRSTPRCRALCRSPLCITSWHGRRPRRSRRAQEQQPRSSR